MSTIPANVDSSQQVELASDPNTRAAQLRALELYKEFAKSDDTAKKLGEQLLCVRQRLPFGSFIPWLASVGIDRNHASYCMRRFSGKDEQAKKKRKGEPKVTTLKHGMRIRIGRGPHTFEVKDIEYLGDGSLIIHAKQPTVNYCHGITADNQGCQEKPIEGEEFCTEHLKKKQSGVCAKSNCTEPAVKERYLCKQHLLESCRLRGNCPPTYEALEKETADQPATIKTRGGITLHKEVTAYGNVQYVHRSVTKTVPREEGSARQRICAEYRAAHPEAADWSNTRVYKLAHPQMQAVC